MHRRPRKNDRGMVTAEAAVVLPVLVVVLAAAVWLLAVVAAQLRCVDAARVAARLAARDEPPGLVQATAREAAPQGATVQVSERDGQVLVVVRARLQPLAVLDLVPSITVSGTAAAVLERTVGLQP